LAQQQSYYNSTAAKIQNTNKEKKETIKMKNKKTTLESQWV
jgi:hypothetical protein